MYRKKMKNTLFHKNKNTSKDGENMCNINYYTFYSMWKNTSIYAYGIMTDVSEVHV